MTKTIDIECVFSPGVGIATPQLRQPGERAGDLPLIPTVRRLSLCPRCSRPSRSAGVPCKSCEAAHIRDSRETLLSEARQSIPSMFRGVGLDSPELPPRVRRREAIGEAARAIDAPRVVLTGPAGRGKTTLACAMAHDILSRALEVNCTVEDWRAAQGLRFVSAYELARATAQHPLGQGEAPLVTRALAATVLILDDVGAEPAIYSSSVADVIYARHARCECRTIVTTGFATAQLADRYGHGITRRLFEGAALIAAGEVGR